ncbi:unnamed protein product [Urochloa decumbens]|uniref:NAD-dependent epimerase/dehydratase domain-containing protein n=1 Tax=Urochloa decumbens TaxID=240449 RepID=A0ABC9GGU6_9POAL
MDDAMATAGDGHPARGGVVCVTGGSGFIGSWLVRYLLDRGYSVHATVRNIQDEGETMHLHALDGAGTRLRLFQIDLLDLPSIRAAIEGAQGVFHLASPLIVQTQDPETELLEPAVKGTLNVLRAAKDSGVGRVVLVSSKAAMVPNPNWPADKHWYGVSKTLAEKAAWDFAAEEGLQLVVLNPGLVLGPFLTPSVNASLNWFLQLLSGKRLDMDMYMGYVDVRDVATSLVTLYETPSPQGRHLCMESIERMVDFTDKVVDLYPEFSVPRIMEDKQSWIVRAKVASKKLISLGILFTPFEKTINDTVECFKSKGLI